MRSALRAGLRSSLALTAQSALVTVVAVTGSLSIIFLAARWLGGMGFFVPGAPLRALPWWFVGLGLTLVLAPPFLGGAAWGWGMARVFGRPVRPAVRVGALGFGGMVLLTAVPTDLTQLWLNDLPGWMPLDVHGYFTLVFMVEVAIVASVAGGRLARHFGVTEDAVRVGLWTGVAGAIGFFLGSWLAVAVDIRIRPWIRYSMVWAFLIANPLAAVAAGAGLGWQMSRRLERNSPGGPRTPTLGASTDA